METIKNKLYAIAIGTIGVLSTLVDGDATFAVFALLLAVPMFFAKDNWIY